LSEATAYILCSSDEIMYDARIHPEQYSNTLSTSQIAQLHKSLHYVCSLAVETRADSSQFPKEWLFKYRWGKGKKDSANRLPNGAKVVFVTVGGRTSAVVPRVQKKRGEVVGDVKDEDQETDRDLDGDSKGGEKRKPAKGKKSTKRAETEGLDVKAEPEPAEKVTKRPSRARKSDVAVKGISAAQTNGAAAQGNKRKTAAKQEPETTAVEEVAAEAERAATENEEAEAEPDSPPTKKRKPSAIASSKVPDRTKKPQPAKANTKPVAAAKGASDGRRRSARVSGVGA
jgi:formamidopyrimidine-DNA glycosylase